MAKETETKSWTQRVEEKTETLAVTYAAKTAFDAAQRKNGNAMRDMLRRAVDARTVKIMAPYVDAVAQTQVAATCQTLGITLPAVASVDATVTETHAS